MKGSSRKVSYYLPSLVLQDPGVRRPCRSGSPVVVAELVGKATAQATDLPELSTIRAWFSQSFPQRSVATEDNRLRGTEWKGRSVRG